MLLKSLVGIMFSGVLLFSDQLLKYIARSNQDTIAYIIKPWLGWEYYANNGIAFNIPLPSAITIAITPIILAAIVIVWQKTQNKTHIINAAFLLIIIGAASNLIDRILFGYTIDYIRLLTSVINLADILIFIGAVLLVLQKLILEGNKNKPNELEFLN